MLPDFDATVAILLRIAVFVPLALLWLAVIVDLFRREDLPKTRKVLWGVLVFLAVHVGVLLYFVLRPVPEPPGKGLAVTADRSSWIVTRLEALRSEYRAGNIADDEYLASKRELLGVS